MTSADSALVAPCWFCSASRPPAAAFCTQCSRAWLAGCVAVMRAGKSYVLGRHAGGGFAIWDQTVAQPVERYGPGRLRPGQPRARLRGEHAGPAADGGRAGRSARLSGLISLIVLVLVFAGIYLYVHAHRYTGCTFTTPGIFEWPSSCL